MSNDENSDAKLKAYRQRAAARVTEIRKDLAQWIEPRENEADDVSITRALLDTALDRHVGVHHADGFDLIESAYRRALERWRGKLQ
jgi:hypothetical protein